MWLQQREGAELRHTCEQSDGLRRYGWLLHDGEQFGLQDIHDRGLLLRTEFVKRPGGLHGGDWSWRVTARPEVGPRPRVVPRAARGTAGVRDVPPSFASPPLQGAGGEAALVSLFFYVATDGQGELRPHLEDGTRLAAVTGTSEELGDFKITFLRPTADDGEDVKYSRCPAGPVPPSPAAERGADGFSPLAATTTWTRGARGCTASPTWCGAV